MKYTIVKMFIPALKYDTAIDLFIEYINKYINLGWTPQGGLSLWRDPIMGHMLFLQAMIWESKEKTTEEG